VPANIRIDGLNKLFNGFWHEGLQKRKSLTLELGDVIINSAPHPGLEPATCVLTEKSVI
jgi:hypothetical protein